MGEDLLLDRQYYLMICERRVCAESVLIRDVTVRVGGTMSVVFRGMSRFVDGTMRKTLILSTHILALSIGCWMGLGVLYEEFVVVDIFVEIWFMCTSLLWVLGVRCWRGLIGDRSDGHGIGCGAHFGSDRGQLVLTDRKINYLKIMDNGSLSQLKNLSFEEVKEEFDKLVKQVESFAPINFEATKDSLKRFGEELQTKTSKRLKSDEAKDDESTKKTGKRNR
ncbi:hypothetical protein Tco_1293009 [Tanacetum coccineum]